MGEKRIAWAITGGGHNLKECIDVLLGYDRVDVFLSRAAEEVLGMYSLDARISVPKIRIYHEAKSSAPLVIRLFGGTYSVLVVAPATSNSVAKFVYGISDTLITNLFAQAGKSKIPVIVYPTDLVPVADSVGPRGQSFKVYPRPIDLDNTAKLRSFGGVTVVGNKQELQQAVSNFA
jgi:dihydromethanopterin reductase (acceptor)